MQGFDEIVTLVCVLAIAAEVVLISVVGVLLSELRFRRKGDPPTGG